MHVLRAGLWGQRANITLASDQGDWGKVYREAAAGEGSVPAYNVKDVAHMFNISSGFDYVKIDIEGGLMCEESCGWDTPCADRCWSPLQGGRAWCLPPMLTSAGSSKLRSFQSRHTISLPHS